MPAPRDVAYQELLAKLLPTMDASVLTHEISFSPNDCYDDILVKLSVKHFTKFYELEYTTLRRIYCSRISSHFRALYHYKNKEYSKVLDLCNVMMLEYMQTTCHAPNEVCMDDEHVGLFPISVLHQYQIFLGMISYS